ncbi:hypothetical protein GCM10022222_59800 [Amycolatopsis ultiminotia]|uniref:Uncharacterized protein n=1 Tax=Amycolatopsis ultiminotia TaxID=543629 RepID=A0ABP6XJ49_9PSEU
MRRTPGLTLYPVKAGLAGLDDVAAAHRRAVEQAGPIDVLFNNSGGPAPAKALEIPLSRPGRSRSRPWCCR